MKSKIPNGSANGKRDAELLPHHLDELHASGLTPETIAANNIYSESDQFEIAKLLNWSPGRAKLLGPVLVYPHYDRDGQPLNHATVKPDNPRDRTDKPGKVNRESPSTAQSPLHSAGAARGPDRPPIFSSQGARRRSLPLSTDSRVSCLVVVLLCPREKEWQEGRQARP